MKFVLLAVFSLGGLFGCSHMYDTKRIPASVDNYQKEPCGLEGSVNERIADCSHQEDATKEGFVLVTRSRDFKEVHKDIKTGLLWSDIKSGLMEYYIAQVACFPNMIEGAGIIGKAWRLPSIQEYEVANSNGIREALPNMMSKFWSSSASPGYNWVFFGTSGTTHYLHRYELARDAARCVMARNGDPQCEVFRTVLRNAVRCVAK